jgi:hypothetical protein
VQLQSTGLHSCPKLKPCAGDSSAEKYTWQLSSRRYTRVLITTNRQSLYQSLSLGGVRRSIRILDITAELPDDDDGLYLSCRQAHVNMRVVDIDDNPTFTALSYVWGISRSPSHSLICQGTHLPITSNCWSALYHLRKVFEPLSIWVDAVCINQQDEREKDTQIPLMGSIYSSASSMYAWLGHETPEAKGVIPYLREAGFQRYLMATGELQYAIPHDRWLSWRIAWMLCTRGLRDMAYVMWYFGA